MEVVRAHMNIIEFYYAYLMIETPSITFDNYVPKWL